MKFKKFERQFVAAILLIGFGMAIIIYFTAGPMPLNPLGYDALETKKYIHDLELYGGKGNVLAAEFREWFLGLWYGTNVAFTVAVITVLIALLVRFSFAMIESEKQARHTER